MVARFHLADLFETVAQTVPDRLAVIGTRDQLTYAQLDARASAIAAGLAARGIGRGDRVGLYLANCPDHLTAFIATVKLGAVPFNINYRYCADELRYLLNNAGAAAVFHANAYGPGLDALRADLPDLTLAIAVDDGSGTTCPQSIPIETLAACTAGGPYTRHEDDIILTYTGGTTGMPKGVMWPHRAFIFACAGGAGYFNPLGPLDSPDGIAERARQAYRLRLFPLAPLMHAAAMWSAWSALLNGLTVVLDDATALDATTVLDTIVVRQVNIVQIVGDAMAIPILDALDADPGRWDLSALVNFGSGGAVFSAHVKAGLRRHLPAGCTIFDGMGSSETGVAGQAGASTDGMLRLPAGPEQAVIVDDRLAQPGETGLIARSGHIPVGYFGDPVKTAETFRMIDGRVWAVSGDAGRLDDDGMITMFGRGSTCINSGGEKVFPEEVEEALRSHPGVFDAVVVGQPDTRWGERVVALVSSREGKARPDFADLRAHLSARLAAYKMPKAITWVDTVRRSAAGKQDFQWAKSIVAEVL